MFFVRNIETSWHLNNRFFFAVVDKLLFFGVRRIFTKIKFSGREKKKIIFFILFCVKWKNKINRIFVWSFFLSDELLGDGRDVLALELGAVELKLGGHAGAVSAGDGRRAVVGAAVDRGDVVLSAPGARKADDDHSLVEQDGVEGEDRCLLAAVLRRRAGDDGADFADELALHPEAAGGVEERLHLAGHHAEAGGRDEDDGIVVAELVGIRDRDVGEGLLRVDGVHLGEDFLGQRLGNALENGLDALEVGGAGNRSLGHLPAVAVGGVEENENLSGAFFRGDVCRGSAAHFFVSRILVIKINIFLEKIKTEIHFCFNRGTNIKSKRNSEQSVKNTCLILSCILVRHVVRCFI